ncbi:proprotein convertase P-domain-containing protein [bacterium]|nr:proprotein convertase P-domain-containing protein [bacterium]
MRLRLGAFLFFFCVFGAGVGAEDEPPPDCMHRKFSLSAAKAAVAGLPERVPGGHDGYDVLAYDLRFHLDPAVQHIVGTATLEIRCTSPSLATLTLDLVGYTVAETWANGATAPYSRDANAELLSIQLPQPITAGSVILVSAQYAGRPVAGNWFGLENGVRYFGNTVYQGGEPAGSRYLYPCNDRPDDKARFRVTTTVPRGYLVSGTGLLVGATSDATHSTFTWNTEHQVTPYALAWAVAPYRERGDDTAAVPIVNYVFSEVAGPAGFDLARTGQMMELYASQFGPYPFEKYGHALIKGYLVLETQTMTTMSQSVITGTRKHEPTVAHELAHQWWGNSITPAEWSEIWLNEGMASFCEVLWIEATEPARVRSYLERFTEEYLSFERVFAVPVGAPEPRFLFSPTIYKKGGWVFHMLRDRVGEAAFDWLLPFAPCALHVDPRDVFLDLSQSIDARRHEYVMQTTGDTQIPGDPLQVKEYSIAVSEDFVIGDVDVRWTVFHQHLGFLEATLVAPSGKSVVLLSRFAPVSTHGTSMEGTVLDDEAPMRLEDGYPPYRGWRRPMGLLAALEGERSAGTWRLRFRTQETGYRGAVDEATLLFLPAPPPAPDPADLNGDGRVDWLDFSSPSVGTW